MEGKRDTVEIEIALQYNDSYTENVFAFANTINTVDGGTHLSGFRSALTRSINNFASVHGNAQGAERRSYDHRRRCA